MNRGKKVLALLWALAWTAWALPSEAAQPRWRVNIASGHCIGKHARLVRPGGGLDQFGPRDTQVQMELKHCRHVPIPRGHTVLGILCKPPRVRMWLTDTPPHKLTVLNCAVAGVIGQDRAFCDTLLNASLSFEGNFTCASRGMPTVFPYFVDAQRVR